MAALMWAAASPSFNYCREAAQRGASSPSGSYCSRWMLSECSGAVAGGRPTIIFVQLATTRAT